MKEQKPMRKAYWDMIYKQVNLGITKCNDVQFRQYNAPPKLGRIT
jgi:hypothetical protein